MMSQPTGYGPTMISGRALMLRGTKNDRIANRLRVRIDANHEKVMIKAKPP